MVNPNAMDDGCLPVVSVRRRFRVNHSLYHTPDSVAQGWWRMGSSLGERRGKVGTLEFLDGRLARVSDTSGT